MICLQCKSYLSITARPELWCQANVHTHMYHCIYSNQGQQSVSTLMVYSHGLLSWSTLMVYSHGLLSWSVMDRAWTWIEF